MHSVKIGRICLVGLSVCALALASTGSSQAATLVDQPRIVSQEQTRKAAEIQCRTVYGPQELFDVVSYLDTDGERSCDVYVFAKDDRWLGRESALLDSIYYHRQRMFAYVDSIRSVDERIADPILRQSRLAAFRSTTDHHLKMSTRPHEFISIYTSASRNHKPVMEYREGLPESYVMRYDIERVQGGRPGSRSSEIEIYYFGPLRAYASIGDGDRRLVSLANSRVELTQNDVAGFLFNRSTLDSVFLQGLDQAWSRVESMSMSAISRTDFSTGSRADHTIPNVPYFRQTDWTNIMPDLNCCTVMAAGSALGYYDHEGYWSICPFATYVGGNPNGGFEQVVGVNYQVSIPGASGNPRSVHFGPETMLYEIALDVGYDFDGGGTVVTCNGSSDLSDLYEHYTDDRLGLNFNYGYACLWGGCTYGTIKNRMNANQPMAISVDYYSWSSSPGPYGYVDEHVVAIVAYDESYWAGTNAIGVYINGTPSYDIVWWDYDQIQSDNPYD